jgi:hypothetical protein
MYIHEGLTVRISVYLTEFEGLITRYEHDYSGLNILVKILGSDDECVWVLKEEIVEILSPLAKI